MPRNPIPFCSAAILNGSRSVLLTPTRTSVEPTEHQPIPTARIKACWSRLTSCRDNSTTYPAHPVRAVSSDLANFDSGIGRGMLFRANVPQIDTIQTTFGFCVEQ
jgi:hypothetical protein